MRECNLKDSVTKTDQKLFTIYCSLVHFIPIYIFLFQFIRFFTIHSRLFHFITIYVFHLLIITIYSINITLKNIKNDSKYLKK